MASAVKQTGYEAGRDNARFLGPKVHGPAFFGSSLAPRPRWRAIRTGGAERPTPVQ